jgi:DNA-binding NarL/FixJ family response regulator
MSRPRILVADDHTLILAGTCVILQTHYEIVGTVSNGRDLIEMALRVLPDVIIMDITMPGLNGIDAAQQIKERLPAVKLVFLTMHVNPAYVSSALIAGGNGYVLKSAANEDLLLALRRVLDGHMHVSPGITRNLDCFRDPARAAESLSLSAREREVLQLIAEGKLAKEIAFTLTVATRTVNFHRENIKHKLGLATTAELTKYAIEQGMI